MRPRTLDEVVGQQHILGPGRLLRRMIEGDSLTSVILHGPAGTGKTSLAEVIAGATKRHFVRENASSVGVGRIREVIDSARRRLEQGGGRTILFLDEIHRFSRSQQDVLLGDVERGIVTLIGATTENPLFACNAALISRSTLFRLEPIGIDEIVRLIDRTLDDPERGFGGLDLRVTDRAKRVWAVLCDGDARRALTALETAVRSGLAETEAPGDPADRPAVVIDERVAADSIQRKAVSYDASGDQHYDAASALIKSVRGSDPDAALYWIAYMLEGGEDPRFIARRLAILASEDVGNADPRAILLAQAGWDLIERIGLPEARITLGQIATYLALAPKSNAAYLGIDAAIADVRSGRTVPVPRFLQDPNTSPEGVTNADAGREKRKRGYEYSHAGPHRVIAGEAFGGITSQEYLGVDARYYRPTGNGHEEVLRRRLDEILRVRRAPGDPPAHRPDRTPDPGDAIDREGR